MHNFFSIYKYRKYILIYEIKYYSDGIFFSNYVADNRKIKLTIALLISKTQILNIVSIIKILNNSSKNVRNKQKTNCTC